MLTRPIPRTQEPIPVVGIGTYRGFDTRDRRRIEQLGQVIRTLFAAGGCVVDSSPMYGLAEDVSGALVAADPDAAKAFIATKVWVDGKAEGVRQMERSLSYFRRDRIDLMQVHNLVDVQTHMTTLQDWQARGKVRYLGVTHYANSAHGAVERAMKALPIDFVQINYSLDNRAVEKSLLPLAQERGIAVIVNYPFGGGALVQHLKNRPLPEFAARHGMTSWAQVLLRFLLGHEAITCVIPGTGNPAHMAANAALGDGDLAAQRAEILAWWSKAAL